MILTVDLAMKVLPIIGQLIIKAVAVLKGGDPVSIDEELLALEGCRLRPSSEVIEDADKATGDDVKATESIRG